MTNVEAFAPLLREPLRGIASYATAVKAGSAAPDDVTARQLDTIGWLASRLDDLLNSLLEYSRLGLPDLRMAPVSLDDVVDDIEEILGDRFADADVQLRRPVRLGTVSGDRIRLQEVLVNLVSNAVKYAAAGRRAGWRLASRMPSHPMPTGRCAPSTFATTASASGPSSRKTSSRVGTRRALAVAVRALGWLSADALSNAMAVSCGCVRRRAWAPRSTSPSREPGHPVSGTLTDSVR